MVDPKVKEKVRQRLSSALAEAEESANKAAETILFQTGKLAAFVRKHSGADRSDCGTTTL